MSWFGCYIGDSVDLDSLFGLLVLAIVILTRGLLLNSRGRPHRLVTVCFAIALGCFVFGFVKGSVATIGAFERHVKDAAEAHVPALLFLRPIVGYGSAAISFSIIAGLLASTKRT